MSLKYVKPYDSLRAFACLTIMLYHWPLQRFSISFGWEALQLFFVLSGYLITRVLIFDKERFNLKNYMYRFYSRRFLRLFPLYFGYLIFFTLLFSLTKNMFLSEVSRNGTLLYTFTYNFMGVVNFLRGMTGMDLYGTHFFVHLWSLSLEEQFYLFFPIIVFILPKKHLRKYLIAVVVLSPIIRFFGYEWLKNLVEGSSIQDQEKFISVNLYHITFFQFDSLAFGGLLAVFDFKWIKRPLLWLTGAVLAVAAIYIVNINVLGGDFEQIAGQGRMELWLTYNYQHIYFFSVVNFACMMVILVFKRGYNIKAIFDNKFLVYFGRLSFGLYLFHLPILFIWLSFAQKKIFPNINIVKDANFGVELFLVVVFYVAVFS